MSVDVSSAACSVPQIAVGGAMVLSSPLRKRKFAVPVSKTDVQADWQPRGYDCQLFRDPPGWAGLRQAGGPSLGATRQLVGQLSNSLWPD